MKHLQRMDNETSIQATWFAHFMTHAVNNILNRDGKVRFSYTQLRRSLTAVENGDDDSTDEEVRKLLQNIVGVLPPQQISDRQARVLFLALMNAHMAYHLVNPDLVSFIEEDNKVE